ncbi:hypothetical protein E4U42_001574, partial [Claviceps africana]
MSGAIMSGKQFPSSETTAARLDGEAERKEAAMLDPVANAALVRRQDRRIVPLAAGIYLLCYLDRSNIGNAKVLGATTHHDLLSGTGMTDHEYTVALMVFLIAYAVFEVPSNYLLQKMRPSRWIAFLMLTWGCTTMGLAGTHSFASVTAVRFLLGVFEAGLFPGLVCYLTFWYRAEERSVRVAAVLASATLAGAFGGAIAFAVGHMDGTRGLAAWRWLFLLEGLPSVVASLFVWFLLPDYPETASWLSDDEKRLAADRLAEQGSRGDGPSLTWAEAKSTLVEWRLWAHYL